MVVVGWYVLGFLGTAMLMLTGDLMVANTDRSAWYE